MKPFSLAGLFGFVLLLSGCGDEPPPAPPRPVLTVTVKTLKNDDLGRFAGSIQARYESVLGFRTNGRIASRLFDVGDFVGKGALLATLDPTDQQNQLRASQGDLASAEAQLIDAQANARRQEELFARSVTAQARLDDARTRLKTSQASFDQAKAAVQQARDQLSYTRLVTDFDGVITTWHAEAGQVVSAGQAVAELARARQVEIRHAILGGEFEYLSFNRNPATGETREGFLGKVERQLERIAGALPCPAATCSFFEMCGGEDGWHRAHGEIVQRLEQGDYGQTGLDYPALESIFLSRLPLYEKWFASQSREQIWASFVSQAAEYALMGKLFGERFDNFVVLAVDHYRMEPFYSFFATVPTLYIRTDYL
ncbi:efflux RND transporter periplasmic adaptor subunit [Pseudomonas aeruginosa]|uniref:efflux RND transporter periplasmic adaptor subunit n=1 Tax=Pseudomonas aeruginosa TaxID=287 RepID=UPI00062C4276|nr:efflux RND transporter periplasmic adaptor subunit [Pseudomonas aeruginosa]MBF2901775.1 efflux RND transporter periplasmic adaptor subunit [Pseudomonas aeruginosa]